MQVLRVYAFCAFSASPALPPCYFPLCLSTSGKVVDLRDIPSIPVLLRSYMVLTVTAHWACTRYSGDLGQSRQATMPKASHVHGNHPHRIGTFLPKFSKKGYRSPRGAGIIILDEVRFHPDFNKTRFGGFAPVVFDQSQTVKLAKLA